MDCELDQFLRQWRQEIHGDNRHHHQQEQPQQRQQNVEPREDRHIGGGYAPNAPLGYTPHEEELLYEPLDEFPVPKRIRYGNEDNKPSYKANTPLFSINVNVAEAPEVDLSRAETEQHTFHSGDATEVGHKGASIVGEEGSAEGRRDKEMKGNDGGEDQSFVDTLIKDLDEINTVPFFDVELPREIALKIFGYLSLKDLCSCAQVSRSWKFLSEDNVLWCSICHTMGHHLESDVRDLPNWKRVVQQVVEKDRAVLQNWRERNCGLTEYQPRGVGILCTVDVHDNIALVGYSDGSVFLWDLTVDNEPAKMTQPTGIYAQSKPSCSVVRGNIAAVGTTGGSLKVFNTYGLCQEHTLLSPGQQPFCHTSAAIIDQSPHIAASYSGGGYVVAWGSGAKTEWSSRTFPPETEGDGEIQQIFVLSTQRESDPCGVIVCHSNCVRLQTVGGHLVDIIQFPERSSRVYYTSHCDTVLGRVDVRTDDSLLAWGSGVRTSDAIKLYDYATGVMKHSISCKLRHAVTALNFGDSPPQMIASGDTDYRVLIHDMRSPSPLVMSLKGHDNVITDVQMDGWKVASGSLDGTCVVWDQRMASLLWQSNARHPVRKCRFQGDYLVTVNIPKITSPELIVQEFDDLGEIHRSIPSRYLGMLRVFDFSVNPLFYTKFLPSICSSAYNEPSASDYNLDLIVPYDDIV